MAVKSYKNRYNTQHFASKKNNSFFFDAATRIKIMLTLNCMQNKRLAKCAAKCHWEMLFLIDCRLAVSTLISPRIVAAYK